MKKFLLMAMVAVAFMACNQNGASVPSSDKKAVKAVTTDAVSMVGQDPAKVEKNPDFCRIYQGRVNGRDCKGDCALCTCAEGESSRRSIGAIRL